jgi:hypothetical protein
MNCRELTISEGEYQFLATSDEARAMIPGKYTKHQPYMNITDPATRLETKAHGIKICSVQIGDPQFVANHLQAKIQQKLSAVEKIRRTLFC